MATIALQESRVHFTAFLLGRTRPHRTICEKSYANEPLQIAILCLVAEHCWDPVGLAIVECANRFERLKVIVRGRR